jgi:hypothetical protein
MGDVEKRVEEHYRSRVLSLLIPVLSSDEATSANEELLATTVILRMSEQFLEPMDDCQHHLKGAASLFFDGTGWSPAEGSLAVACFWTHLRESIRICFLRQQPCRFNADLVLGMWSEDSLCSTGSEEAWTNRMTLLMLEVCTLCWDITIQDKKSTAECLGQRLRIWKERLPASFNPWAVCEVETEPFPAIRCLSPWHGERFSAPVTCISFTDRSAASRGMAVLLHRQYNASRASPHGALDKRACHARIHGGKSTPPTSQTLLLNQLIGCDGDTNHPTNSSSLRPLHRV